jgi:hypothetical protein
MVVEDAVTVEPFGEFALKGIRRLCNTLGQRSILPDRIASLSPSDSCSF